MFSYLIFSLVAAITVLARPFDIPPDLQEVIDGLHETCREKMGISDADIKNYVITNNDPKMMCYMKCLMLESQWLTADGTIQYDYITSNAHEAYKDLIADALKSCQVIEDGSHECEKAYNFNVCIQKADPVNWFLP